MFLAAILYLGFIKTESIDVLLHIDGHRVIGATYRSYDRKLCLLTGTADDGHLTLRERSDPWTEVAAIDARMSPDGLRGTWGGRAFEFLPGSDSPLIATPRSSIRSLNCCTMRSAPAARTAIGRTSRRGLPVR